MEIIIPSKEQGGKWVLDFLEISLSIDQKAKALIKMEGYEKIPLSQLMRLEKIKKIKNGLPLEHPPYELRVRIDRANLRFFGFLSGENLIILHVIDKDTDGISDRDLRTIKERINLFNHYY